MHRESRSRKVVLRQRSAPSLTYTVQALRAIRGQVSRTALETRIIAMRSSRQLT